MSFTRAIISLLAPLQRRPLLTVTLLWIFGIMLASRQLVAWQVWAGCALLLLLVWLPTWAMQRRASYLLLACATLFLSTGYAAWRFASPTAEMPHYLPAGAVEIIGFAPVPADVTPYGWHCPMLLKGRYAQGKWLPATGKVYLSGRGEVAPEVGRYYRIFGNVEQEREMGNAFDFSWRPFLRERGMHYRVQSKALIPLSNSARLAPWPAWRAYCASRLAATMPSAYSQLHAHLLQSLILGIYGAPLPEQLTEQFRQAGLLHLVVVSGSQISLLGMLFLLPMGLLPYGQARASYPRLRRVLLLASLPVLGLYVLLADRGPSVDRALLMVLLVALSLFCAFSPLRLRRSFHPDGLTLLAAAAWVLLIGNPALLFGASFQLSFAAVAGLMTITPLFMRWWRLLPAALTLPLAATLGAQILTTPVLAWHFGVIPLLAPLTNLIAVPAVVLLLPLGLCAMLCALFFPVLATGFNYLCLPLLKLLTLTGKYAAACDWAQWHYYTRSPLALLVYLAVVALLAVGLTQHLNRRVEGWDIPAGKEPRLW